MQWLPNKWTVTRGDDAQVILHLLDADGTPLNLSGASAIKLVIKNQDNSKLTLDPTQGITAGLARSVWIYSYMITAEQSALLPLSTNAVVEAEIHFSSFIQRFPIASVLTVIDPIIL